MLKNLLFIGLFISIIFGKVYGQNTGGLKAGFLKQNIRIFPGEVVNLPVSIENTSENSFEVDIVLQVPLGWKAIINKRKESLKAGEKKMLFFSIQSSGKAVVGDFQIIADIWKSDTKDKIGTLSTIIQIKELEDISMLMVQSRKHVIAGEDVKALFLVQNNGNTTKKVYLETVNCEVVGGEEVEVKPGQSVEVTALSKTNIEIKETNNTYLSVRAVVGEKVYENIHHSFIVFPQEKHKKDLFFRYPLKSSATYIYTNTTGEPVSGYQFEVFGSGYLDVDNKHFLEILARVPDNQDMGFMGLYDQYYITYQNNNLYATFGEQTYQFTELTEMSRFGMGAETRIKTNSGLKFGAIYVQPRFYEEIKNEFAGYTGFEFTKDNWLDLFYIAKNSNQSDNYIHLLSLSGNLIPFESTSVGFEVSGGHIDGYWDKAYRVNLNTQFSIFQLAGNYSLTGEKYPGYYSNSKFYSANISARLSKKMNVGFYAKEDFQNAQLDTFFVTAPYSKSYQAILNYSLARKANFKIFWRKYERKDRLSTEKFHYETQSLNSQFTHKFKSYDYSLFGEYGKTTDYQSSEIENQQNTYRVSGNFGYHYKGKHSVQFFGSWSNVNSFITDDQRNLTWGISASTIFSKNFQAMFYFQNAYNIEDYYQNRNLMQTSLDYTFLKNHKISLRSFYTLFKQETEDPDLSASITYTCNIGIPLKQVIQAGDLVGTITYEDGRPAENVILNILNRKAITNKNGEFAFTDLQPGTHLLFVNRDKFEIDEVSSIPLPAQIEIIGNQETSLHVNITKGARLAGRFKISNDADPANASNIVIELKNEFDQFRIASDSKGNFSFPLVRPGKYRFKIYPNSIPEGFSVKLKEYSVNLGPGEQKELEIELIKKKRNIIFSSNNFVLTPKTNSNIVSEEDENEKSEEVIGGALYYTIQVGAFKRKKSKESRFFEKYPFDKETYKDGYYKYFIGRFETLAQAQDYLKVVRKNYRNPFIVKSYDTYIPKTKSTEYRVEEVFYSVQVGAFRLKKTNESRYFSDYPFEFERYSNNLNKYFIGKFKNIEDARKLRTQLSRYYRNPFVVIFENGKIKPVQ